MKRGRILFLDGILVDQPGLRPHYAQLRELFRENPLDVIEVFCPLEVCRVDTQRLSPAECADRILRELFPEKFESVRTV